MRRSKRGATLSVLLLGLSLWGTAASAQSPGAPGGVALEGTDWALTELQGSADPSAVPVVGADLLLLDGQASGFGGCNRFATSYALDGSSLTFGVPASTMMACPDAAMAFESVYLGALPTVASYQIAGGALQLLDGTGGLVLGYAAQGGPAASGEPSPLVGAWTATRLNNGSQGVVTLPEQPVVTVSFLPDGTVQASGGCNQLVGPYEVARDSIAIGPLASTTMACGEPADTTEQQLAAALDASTVWSIRGGELDLRDGSGALQVGLTASIAAPTPS